MIICVVISSVLFYLCGAVPVQQADWQPNVCGEFLTHINTNTNTTTCYHMDASHKTWNAAEADCIQLGGHLASIHDDVFNTFIFNAAEEMYSFEGVHIGLSDTNPGISGFGWSDGSVLNYSNFGKSMPNINSGHCLYMQIINVQGYAGQRYAGQWYSEECDGFTMGHVCVRPTM
ncbi:hypothetical protein PENTCL1PPCAC_8363 [Pristionchus entomophagus]|uniref:C-type lectin domain-containing protein n=1 Tax=Pristionchus entomophagus TaxID=358040 RepID=A0AAV5T010_9BILA|nr:hypothetical protein PENTCL1PPCAC_8363 [Pristionchus entomophagus]